MTAIGRKQTFDDYEIYFGYYVDWITTLLITLLIATLIAYFYGIFPYPYGWLILIAILVVRLASKRQKMNK